MRFCGVDLCGVHPALSIEKEYPPGMPDRDVYTIAGRDGEIAVGYAVVQGEYKVNVNIAARRREEGWRIRGLLAAWAMASGQDTGRLSRRIGRAWRMTESLNPSARRNLSSVSQRWR